MTMHTIHADVKPATSLLSLPDELIERICTEYYLEERQAEPQKPHGPVPIICKRVSTLVEHLWLQTIRFHASRKTTELFLAKLIRSDPNKRAAVRDLEIYVHPDSTVLVYAVIANLPSLRSLCLRLVDKDLQDYKGRPMGSADSRSGLQNVLEHCVNLRRLQTTSQSLPLENCRLPATIEDIALDAGSFDASTADNLQQAGITRLELHFWVETDATDFADLPWTSLQRLVLIFHDDALEATTSCVERLAQQSLHGSKATNLQALEIKVMGDINDLDNSGLDHLRRAFQQCPITHLALYSDGIGLDFELDGDWPTLTHLSFHISDYDFLRHRLEDFATVLQRCDELVSLTLRGVDFSTCECCYVGVKDFIELDEEEWSPRGRNLLAIVYLARYQTKIRHLRIQSDDGRHELRWTRTSAAEDFAVERWTLF